MLFAILLGSLGHAKFSAGVFVGGMLMQTKHNYKREDVKKKALEKWYENYLKNEVYPNLEKVKKDADDALEYAKGQIDGVKTIDELGQVSDDLAREFSRRVVTPDSLLFFQRYAGLASIQKSDSLDKARGQMESNYKNSVGTLTVTSPNPSNPWTTYKGTSGVWQKVAQEIDKNSQQQRTALDVLITSAPANIKGTMFESLVTQKGGLDSTDPLLTALNAAATAYNTSKGATEKTTLQQAGNAVMNKWALLSIMPRIKSIFSDDEIDKLLQFESAIQDAVKSYAEDQTKPPSPDEYAPAGAQVKPLTSPLLSEEPGEQGKWETLEGEEQSKRIGLTYGFSVGYEKETDSKHTFVGGNVFAKKDSLTIKYALQVKDRANVFGELESKPGYTFGVTVMAGRHLNPAFSVFGRGTFEFTKWDFTYNLTNDSPKMANDKIASQKMGNWIKQAAVGVGARYNFAPLWAAEVCYDFIPATKTTVRDFTKAGEEDKRRRGYIYTASQHRVFLKVVRFFGEA